MTLNDNKHILSLTVDQGFRSCFVFFFFSWTIPSLGLSAGVTINSTLGFQDICEFFDTALIKRWSLFLLLNLGWLVIILINRCYANSGSSF